MKSFIRKSVKKKKFIFFLSALFLFSSVIPCTASETDTVDAVSEQNVENIDSTAEKQVKKVIFSTSKKKALDDKEENTAEPEQDFEDDPTGPQTDEKVSALMSQLETMFPSENGIWAVYVCDLVHGTEDSLNDKSMQAASLIKLYIMGAIFEDYENIISTYGQGNVDSNLYYMITVSDNEAANTLVSYLGNGDSSYGMTVVNNFCLEHGFTASHMGRLLLHSNEFGDNYTSVADCGHLLKAIYQKSDEFPYAEKMFELLTKQERTHKIPSQLPAGVHTANKTGELADVENDAAIIYDTANDLVIVFMSEYLSSVGSAQNSIGSLSRFIYDYYNN